MVVDLEAVESLTELGLTEYESRCFVALTQLSTGTAKEVSRLADVPQSRVYDVGERLHRMGVVDIQESEPRRYAAIPVDLALARLRKEYDDALVTAERRLATLEKRADDAAGVWKVAERGDVADRFEAQLEAAESSVHLLVADREILERAELEALSSAVERGVSVHAEVTSESLRDRLHEAAPGVRIAVSELPLESLEAVDWRPGRLVLVDRRAVLLSAKTVGLVPDKTAETGLWSEDVGHGVVDWLGPLLEARLESQSFDTA